MSVSTADPLVGHWLDDRYEIVRRVARGGMAMVYEGVDTRLSRIVAVKVMHEGLGDDPDYAGRFDTEARAAALLTHPNAVSVFDQGLERNRPYIVMEYVDGMTLRSIITREAPLDPLRALELLEPATAAVAAAHHAGLVHRDVKPENVLISRRGQVKVADFGLASTIEASAERRDDGVVIGTASYLAPELVTHGHADPRCDVYSLGIVLYELLTGTKPHKGATAMDVAYSHVNNRTPAPSAAAPVDRSGRPVHIPDYVDALVDAATARQRVDRPRDAGVLLAHVRRVREALARGRRSDPVLAESVRATRLDDEDTRITPLPAFVGFSALPEGPREVLFAPFSSASPSFEVFGDGIPFYADGGPSPLSPASASRSMPILPRSQWQHTQLHRRRRRLVSGGVLALVLAIALGGWWFGYGRLTPVPALAGLTGPQAQQVAASDGLAVRTENEYSDTVAPGLVARTDPVAGARTEPGAQVTVYLSRGAELFTVPALTGLGQDAALAALTAASLAPGSISETHHDRIAAGLVISQSVSADTRIPRTQRVDLVVSKGPQAVTLPDVTGRTRTDARGVLAAAGLRTRVLLDWSATVPEGSVISQRPGGGQVHRGDTITIVVSRGARAS